MAQQQVNMQACSSHCPFNAERQDVNTNLMSLLMRLGSKPDCTVQEADALTTQPSDPSCLSMAIRAQIYPTTNFITPSILLSSRSCVYLNFLKTFLDRSSTTYVI